MSEGRADSMRPLGAERGPLSSITHGARPVAALVGNPNVGKSTLFNRLTGVGVVTAHYPGKTTEFDVAVTRVGESEVQVIDLPGAYGVDGSSEERWVTRRALLDALPDVVIAVVDANNLARNLFLTLQLQDLGSPLVVALNLVDEAARRGMRIDSEKLSLLLGLPVVPIVATQGVGIDNLMDVALAVASAGGAWREPPSPRYSETIEAAVREVGLAVLGLPERPYGLPVRALAIRLLAGDEELAAMAGSLEGGAAVVRVVREARERVERRSGESFATMFARKRHGLAGMYADESTTLERPHEDARNLLWRLTTSSWTALPILLTVLGSLFAFLFFAGEALSAGFSRLWAATASPVIQEAVHRLLGVTVPAKIALWGFDAGIEASLAIGLPYILVFYFLLAFLEDSGYLGSVAFLADRVMHRFGLHGRAVIPLVAAAGCNVPAVLAVRVLGTRRERFIASALVAFVPCSARTAVVLGSVGYYMGWKPAAAVFLVVTVVVVTVGVVLGKLVPGPSSGLVMEMFPFRVPSVRAVTRKAWGHFREFLLVATPIVIVGSLVLGTLYETGWLFRLASPLRPIAEVWLGLPAVAGLTLLAGLLRKELSLQLLLAMALASGVGAGHLLSFMGPTQLFVYALVNTLAIPCVSTVAVLKRELGWGGAAGITGLTVAAALLLGGLAAHALPLLGWS